MSITETFGPLNHPNILVLGHGEHGKGTTSEILCSAYGHETCSSSEVAFPYIYPLLKEARDYSDEAEALEHKKLERLLWKEAITLLNSPDKSTLSKLILSKANIYDGMRCHMEFEASKHLFDHIIWVDASRRKPVDPSMAIKFDPDTMHYLDNNGTEQELLQKLSNLYESYIWS